MADRLAQRVEPVNVGLQALDLVPVVSFGGTDEPVLNVIFIFNLCALFVPVVAIARPEKAGGIPEAFRPAQR